MTVDGAAKKLNLPSALIDEMEERAEQSYVNPFTRMKYPLGRNSASTRQDQIFEAQKNIIEFLAQQQSCVIVGRCADSILLEEPQSMHIYIYAPYKKRLEHCIQDLKLTEEEGRKMIQEVDAARAAYHEHYAGYLPNEPQYKDIMINSAFLGVEQTAVYLAELARARFRL